MLAIADVFGARPVLVGHSMGAFVTALASSRAPERVAGSVLVDGGFAFPPPAEFDIDAALTAVIGPAMARLSMRFASPEAYLDFWRPHPALGPGAERAAGARGGRYALHDLVQTDDGDWVSSCVLDAIRADGADVLADPETHAAAVSAAPPGCRPSSSGRRADCQNEAQGLYDEAGSPRWGCRTSIRVTPHRRRQPLHGGLRPNGTRRSSMRSSAGSTT